MRQAPRSLLPLLILALALPLGAVDRQLIGSLLDKTYKSQDLALRTSNSGATLRYSEDGHLLKGGKPGPWTLDTNIRCTGVELKHKALVIKGKRLYFLYDKKQERLWPYFGPPVDVEIAIDHDPPSLTTLQQAIANVFVTGSENSMLLVPDYWKDYLLRPTREATTPPLRQMSAIPLGSMQKLTGESKQQDLPLTSIYAAETAGSPGKKQNVTPPVPTHKPEPPYTPEARMAGVEGTAILSVVIDASGGVEKESIIRPLGMGLDDSCARTIQTWRFKPGTRDGKPVAVRVLVEVSFRFH